MNQRLAVGEQNAGHTELREVIEHAGGLVPSEFAKILARVRIGVAMNAFEVAAARGAPWPWP